MSPIPVHDNTYQVQVVFEDDSASGNTFQNTLYFGDIAVPFRSHAAVADAIKTVLDDFYSDFQSILGGVIDVASSAYKVYDLGEPAPRIPLTRPITITVSAVTDYPNEVAAVLSYRSGPATLQGGSPDPTRRGRIYLGPLSTTAGAADFATTGDMVFTTANRTLVATAATNMANNTQDLAWLQYSRKLDRFDFVTGGFVNNTFDTQRRRGAEATGRTVWVG